MLSAVAHVFIEIFTIETGTAGGARAAVRCARYSIGEIASFRVEFVLAVVV